AGYRPGIGIHSCRPVKNVSSKWTAKGLPGDGAIGQRLDTQHDFVRFRTSIALDDGQTESRLGRGHMGGGGERREVVDNNRSGGDAPGGRSDGPNPGPRRSQQREGGGTALGASRLVAPGRSARANFE